MIGFEEMRKSQENTFQNEQRVPEMVLRQSDTKLRLITSRDSNQLERPSNDEQPLYEDFLISNAQQIADLNQEEKLSQCSEPADLQNVKMIHPSAKHMLIQKDSSSFRYDSYDMEVAPEFDETPGQDQAKQIKVQKILPLNNQAISSGSGELNLNNQTSKQGQQQKRCEGQLRRVESSSNNDPNENLSANLNNQETRNDENSNQDQQQLQLQGLDKDNSYEKLNQLDFSDQNQINIVNKGPRRPLSPYIFFSQEKRKELKKEHPDWNSSQIMKMVSVLWQKMSADEKRDFQEQSKKDRERYENERQEFVHKKQEDESHEEGHTVLETVKNRSRILKQQQQVRRKQSEDHIYYTENLIPRKGRRQRKDSAYGEENSSENFENLSKRQRKTSKDSKPSIGQSSLELGQFLPTHQQQQSKEESKLLTQDNMKDKDNEIKLFQVTQQRRALQSQSYSSGDIRQKIENIDSISRQNQERNERVNQDIQPSSLQKLSSAGLQTNDKTDSMKRQQELIRSHKIGPINTTDAMVAKHRILPSPLVSSTSLQNYYTPNESPYPQNYIRSLPSPTPQQLGSQRIPYQQQFQQQIPIQPQIYQGHHQFLQGYAIPQQPQYIGIAPGQQISQFIQPQLGQPSQYITASVPEQFMNPPQQMAYFLQQSQPQQQAYYDQAGNLQQIQQIPQGNPQNPPHAPVQQQNSSHELAQFFQACQSNPTNTGFQGFIQGNNYSLFDDANKQQQQQQTVQSLPQQLSIQTQNFQGFQPNVGQGGQQYISQWGYQDPKLMQRESAAQGLRGLQIQAQNNNDDDFNEFQNAQMQRLNSGISNAQQQSNFNTLLNDFQVQGNISNAPLQIAGHQGLLMNSNNNSSAYLQYPFNVQNISDTNLLQFQPAEYQQMQKQDALRMLGHSSSGVLVQGGGVMGEEENVSNNVDDVDDVDDDEIIQMNRNAE